MDEPRFIQWCIDEQIRQDWRCLAIEDVLDNAFGLVSLLEGCGIRSMLELVRALESGREMKSLIPDSFELTESLHDFWHFANRVDRIKGEGTFPRELFGVAPPQGRIRPLSPPPASAPGGAAAGG